MTEVAGESSGLKYEGHGINSSREVSRIFFEKHENFYPENARILDCGAGNGIFSLLAATKAGASVVYAFEGYYRNFFELLGNVIKNSLYGIVADDHHIMGSTGRLHMNVKDGVVNLAGQGEEILVETRCIDDLALPKLDVIKITVPGAAAEILAGASVRIGNDLPSLIVEVLSNKEGKLISRSLERYGYTADSEVEFARLGNTDGKLLFFRQR